MVPRRCRKPRRYLWKQGELALRGIPDLDFSILPKVSVPGETDVRGVRQKWDDSEGERRYNTGTMGSEWTHF